MFKNKSCLRRFLNHTKILSVGHLISVSFLVKRLIGIENDSNSNTQQSHRQYLLQTAMEKVSNNKSFVRSSLVKYKSHSTNSIQKTVYKKQCTSSHVAEESTTTANIFPARRHSWCSATPADACKPTPLAE